MIAVGSVILSAALALRLEFKFKRHTVFFRFIASRFETAFGDRAVEEIIGLLICDVEAHLLPFEFEWILGIVGYPV